MRGLIGLLAFLLTASFSLVTAVPRPELLPAARLAQSNRDSIKVWVFFRDKGSFGLEAVAQRAAHRIARKGSSAVSAEAERMISPEYVRQIEGMGARVWQMSRWLNAVSAWVAPEKLAAIERLPFVAGFRPVARFVRKPDPEPSEPTTELPPQKVTETAYADSYGPTITQLDSLNIPLVHTLGRRGDSVLVAMLDDGYRKSHSVFNALYNNGQVLAEYDFIQKDSNTAPDSLEDLDGQGNHGTSTWSIVGGTVPGSFLGGAFKANFILAKTEYIPTETKVEEDNWVAGMEWADSIGADVISSSLGYFDFDPPDPSYSYSDLDGATAVTSIAASMAADLGILVCNAAGNSGPLDSTLITPADAFDIFACGAVDSFGVLTVFSSKGPTADGRIKPELVAQGSRTYLADPLNLSGYRRSNGTSFSTPLIASASAVLMSVHPDWAPRQIREALMLSANNAGSPNSQRGWGVPDVYKAALFRPDSTVTLEVVQEGNIANVPVGTPSYQIKVVVHNPRSFPVVSPLIYYREISGSSFSSVALTPAAGDTFTAAIPIASSDREIVFYASANGGVVKDPVFASIWFYRLILRPWLMDDADMGPFDWKTTGTNSAWGPSGRQANSSFLSFGDSPRGNYRNNVDERLEMNRGVRLDTTTNYFLRYFERYALVPGDSIMVQVSTDGGLNWSTLAGTVKTTGTLSIWTERIVTLGAYYQSSDFRVRFRLKSDATGVADGWFVDDVSILQRGDLNGDGQLTPADVVLELQFVFNGIPPAAVPQAAGDMNGDLQYLPSDAVCHLNTVFSYSPCSTP
ncbi:MAG: S8 family serine peptidase [Limisphaerales bacterium]